MKTVIYRNIDQKVVKEWQALWEKSSFANYTNSPQWFLSTKEAFHYKDFLIIALYQKEKLVAVGGLIKERKYGLDFYTVAPNDFVCGIPFLMNLEDQEIVNGFRKQLLELGNIFLSNITEEFIEAFDKDTCEMNYAPQSTNYYFMMKHDVNGIVAISKRNKLMHEVRGIEEKFTLQSFNGTTSKGLDIAFTLDNQSRKQNRGYNIFAASEIKEFYKSLSKYFRERLLINILYFENTPIAYEIGFVIGKNYFGSQMAYISEYKQYSPGKVILVKVADLLSAKGILQWDMGSGESPVKRLVTEEKRELYQYILSKNKFTREYVMNVSNFKNYAFEQLHKHVKTYSVYRKIKKVL